MTSVGGNADPSLSFIPRAPPRTTPGPRASSEAGPPVASGTRWSSTSQRLRSTRSMRDCTNRRYPCSSWVGQSPVDGVSAPVGAGGAAGVAGVSGPSTHSGSMQPSSARRRPSSAGICPTASAMPASPSSMASAMAGPPAISMRWSWGKVATRSSSRAKWPVVVSCHAASSGGGGRDGTPAAATDSMSVTSP